MKQVSYNTTCEVEWFKKKSWSISHPDYPTSPKHNSINVYIFKAYLVFDSHGFVKLNFIGLDALNNSRYLQSNAIK